MYSNWFERFQCAFAERAAAHGAIPMIQLQPINISLPAIVAGRYDAYLRSYASAVRAYGRPVILSFAHEMNGNWYSWGYPHVSPAVWVAAWRHVVSLFRALGATNVTWLWAPNAEQPGDSALECLLAGCPLRYLGRPRRVSGNLDRYLQQRVQPEHCRYPETYRAAAADRRDRGWANRGPGR